MKTSYPLGKLARLLNAECRGDADVCIIGIATIDTATSGQITFLAQPRYRQHLADTQASAVILSEKDADACPVSALVMQNPYLGYAKAAALFAYVPEVLVGVHSTAVVGEGAVIHPTASIGAYCVIGRGAVISEHVNLQAGCYIGDYAKIGAHSYLHARVTLYAFVEVGQRAILHSGAVLGSDGFGFAPEKGVWHKIAQIGTVRVGDDVEIGANTTIDRGALGDTVIGNGVKLDNQIQIAHNVHVGDHTAMAACVGIAGSTRIGRHCMLGGAASVGGHLTIVDRVVITGMAMITKSIDQPGIYSSGTGFQENRAWQKSAVRFRQLDDIVRRVAALEQSCQREFEKDDNRQ